MNMTGDIHAEKILILDFGSQYSQLIARRVRELGVYCELHPYDWDEESIRQFAPQGVILSGGPDTVTFDHTARAPQLIFDLNVPVFGICYGMQTMAAQLGGEVLTSAVREFGYARVTLQNQSRLFEGIEDAPKALDVWMSHGDKVTALPAGFQAVAVTDNAPIAAMSDEGRHFYGVQFHPEVTHTKQGKAILSRFVKEICGCQGRWKPENIITAAIEDIRKKVGNDGVILGLSGGVDSSVVAALLHRAIGSQLTCVFVDTGLLRLNETTQVQSMFGDHFGLHLITVDAKDRFYAALSGVSDPEEKRKIIGREFVHVFQEVSENTPNIQWLAQGTIYPDVIESAATKHNKSEVIKSHHNVGGLPESLHLKLLEPLRELFKDEVRQLGLELGLPFDMVHRHPFPGPGLAVRILGAIQPEFAIILQKADAIFIEELHKAGLYHQVQQAFAVFLPVKSVGVMGDSRQYDYVIALRAVETIDFMTAHWAALPHEFLGRVSNRIINEVSGISRVVYDISGKPPATIEWE